MFEAIPAVGFPQPGTQQLGVHSGVQLASYPWPPPPFARVTKAAGSIFAQAKETIARVWDVTVRTFQAAGDSISFIFFRILEVVRPVLGPKVEVIWVRITNVWQRMKANWQQQEMIRENEALKNQNQDLQGRFQHLARNQANLAAQNAQILQANAHLAQHQAEALYFKHENQILIQSQELLLREKRGIEQLHNEVIEENELLRQAKMLLEQNNGAQIHELNLIEQQRVLADESRNLVIQEKELIAADRDRLGLDNKKLFQDHTKALIARDQALLAKQEADQALPQIRGQLKALQSQLDLVQTIQSRDQILTRIADAAEALKPPQKGIHRTELNHDIEVLLPQLNAQKVAVVNALGAVAETLPENCRYPADSLVKILKEEGNVLERSCRAIELHSNTNLQNLQLLPTSLGGYFKLLSQTPKARGLYDA
ncbi:MAG: hypothetical protein V4487_02755 [Chlamydiota bacterium]